jgi:Fe-S cluster assembly iron-binding protein IscA
MLTVTENAKAHLHDLISQNSIGDKQAIRLVPRENGLGLAPDAEKPTDTAYDHNGRTVLVVDQSVAEQLADRTLDVKETSAGKQLSLT